MKREVIVRLHASFEELVQRDDTGNEFWRARDLQELLGYAKWGNFAKVIDKARLACQGSGHDADDHFLEVRKMVDLGSAATRSIDGVALTRYACYRLPEARQTLDLSLRTCWQHPGVHAGPYMVLSTVRA